MYLWCNKRQYRLDIFVCLNSKCRHFDGVRCKFRTKVEKLLAKKAKAKEIIKEGE